MSVSSLFSFSVWTGGITDMKENSSEFVWATGNPVSSSNWADGASKSSAMNNTHRGIAMDCRRQYKWEAQGIEESHHFMCQSPPLQLSDGENLEDSVIVPVAEPECKVSRGRSPRPRKDFDCPPPFFRLGYSCYLFHRGIGKKTWTDSQRFCKRLAPYGKLAEFETFAEYYTMMQYLIKDGDCEKWKSTDEDDELLDHPHSKKKPFICEADPREDTM
ncbi:unnamed protein product [Cyprideis torosa]|uniref:Uncharacterized protein n=1 Tax=Cyprideis torosa TaxID=163714 RepID=A0A7R8WN94_9CRUS|nr:unnamed protein product [Cyprideis torosa]CAG0900350.1 unnamed protein product [Cyprideis torosa]